MHQEPLKNDEIEGWAKEKYGVTFPLFSKINVNGDEADPLFEYLKKHSNAFLIDSIKWNFTKFLISKKGVVLNRYAPSTNPTKIEKDIEQALCEIVENLENTSEVKEVKEDDKKEDDKKEEVKTE